MWFYKKIAKAKWPTPTTTTTAKLDWESVDAACFDSFDRIIRLLCSRLSSRDQYTEMREKIWRNRKSRTRLILPLSINSYRINCGRCLFTDHSNSAESLVVGTCLQQYWNSYDSLRIPQTHASLRIHAAPHEFNNDNERFEYHNL